MSPEGPATPAAEAARPELSVVVPAYNEQRLIRGTLAAIQGALAPLQAAGLRTELLVVDNASSDATARAAAACGVRVIHEPQRQIARARNAGAARARGHWLLFVDADCTPSAALMADLHACLRDPRVAGGGSTLHMSGLRLPLRALQESWNGLSRGLRWAAGSFLFCRAEAFRELGGFSEALYAAEEIDLSRRLKRWARARGLRLVILHRHPLCTSGRKLELYSGAEIRRSLWRMLRHPRRFFRSREACHLWYDGRR